MKELGLKERACKNMLANALDMDDQNRFVRSILLNSIFLFGQHKFDHFFLHFFYMDDQHMFVCLIFLIFQFLTLSHVRSAQVGSFSFFICLDMDDQHILDIMIWNLDHINFDVWIFLTNRLDHLNEEKQRVKMIGVMMKRRTMKEMNWVIKVGKAMFTVHNQSDWALWESLQNIKWDLFNLPRNWIYASNFRVNIWM